MKRLALAVLFFAPVALTAQQAAKVATPQGVATPASKPVVSHAPASTTLTVAEQNALVKQYCVTCHNDRGKDRTSGLSFQSFDAATAADHAAVTGARSSASIARNTATRCATC